MTRKLFSVLFLWNYALLEFLLLNENGTTGDKIFFGYFSLYHLMLLIFFGISCIYNYGRFFASTTVLYVLFEDFFYQTWNLILKGAWIAPSDWIAQFFPQWNIILRNKDASLEIVLLPGAYILLISIFLSLRYAEKTYFTTQKGDLQ